MVTNTLEAGLTSYPVGLEIELTWNAIKNAKNLEKFQKNFCDSYMVGHFGNYLVANMTFSN